MKEMEELISEKLNNMNSYLAEAKEILSESGNNEAVFEMSTVKWGFMSIKLAIYGSEGSGYPHFHFFKNLKPEGGIPESYRSGGGCLSIESANYFVHGGHKEKLDPKEIKGLIKFLNEKNQTIKSVTNWEYIVALWNDSNPDQKQLPLDIDIPDYKSDMGTIQENPTKYESGQNYEVKDKYFFEMAGRIPGELKVYEKGGDILIIAVGADETRGEAHFHIFRSKKDLKAWRNGACLLFKENKYFDHGDNMETLTKDELNTVINCLNSTPEEGLPGETYWQYLICLWNGNNYDFRIDLGTPVLDYDYETITGYKEKVQEMEYESKHEDLMDCEADEPFLEMATIAIDQKLNINVNPEPGRLSIAYFRVFNAKSFRAATKVARLHFKDSGMEYHKDRSGKQPWALNFKEIKQIVRLMQEPSAVNKQYTNWQIACYQWNLENGLIDQGVQDYFDGKYDHKYDNDTRLREAYVPSTQEMPEEGWIYDPPKGK